MRMRSPASPNRSRKLDTLSELITTFRLRIKFTALFNFLSPGKREGLLWGIGGTDAGIFSNS